MTCLMWIIFLALQIRMSDLGPSLDEQILIPRSFQANFCAGNCKFPLRKFYNTTNHSFHQSVAQMRLPDLFPEPCCVPVEFSSMSVAYTERSGEFAVEKWHNVIARSCGCR